VEKLKHWPAKGTRKRGFAQEKAMETRMVKALVIGNGAGAPSSLVRHLEERNCSCELGESYAQAGMLLESRKYDLVLSPMRIGSSSMVNLMNVLKGTSTTVFYFVAMEQGCWWLPAMSHGEFSFGGNAYRPNEFLPILDRAIEELRSGENPALSENAL
jgi:DNA-binding NtrC family response regulator